MNIKNDKVLAAALQELKIREKAATIALDAATQEMESLKIQVHKVLTVYNEQGTIDNFSVASGAYKTNA